MSKIDVNQVYIDRIEQIDKDTQKEIAKKHWGMVAKLRTEKAKLEKLISG